MRGKARKPHITCPERMAWLQHRHTAKERGIDFHFSYEEWIEWWKSNLGPDWFKKRGSLGNQYVMARNGDKGPYAPWNIKCITAYQNGREALINGRRAGKAKLTKDQVIAIYLELKNNRYTCGRVKHKAIQRLRQKYKVSDSTISNIKDKLTWRHVTALLD